MGMKSTYGCIRSILSAFKKPLGVPSATPMLKIVLGLLTPAFMLRVVVPPAETVTLAVDDSSSPSKRVAV